MKPGEPAPDDDDFADDPDEALDPNSNDGGLWQKLLTPLYLVLLLAFIGTLSVPLLMLYTMAWTAIDAKSY